MRLTAFIVTHRRAGLLERCVRSALAALPEDAELRIVVNGSDRDSEHWLSTQRDPRLQWTVCPREPRTLCRNRGFTESRGDILHFLDDDVEVPAALFHDVLARFDADPSLAVLGGPNRTPPCSPWQEKVYGAVMTSPFAAPFVFRRYAESLGDRDGSEHDLILCNLALRRSRIPEGLRFEDGLRSNEENLFLFECRRQGLRILASGQCFVFHRRRSTLTGFLRQILSYGFGRAQQTWRAPSSTHPAFLVPAVCLVLGPLALTWQPSLGLVYLAFAALGSVGSRSVRELGPLGGIAVVGLTPLVHGLYGLGFWAGCGQLFGSRLTPVDPSVVQADERSRVAEIGFPARGSAE